MYDPRKPQNADEFDDLDDFMEPESPNANGVAEWPEHGEEFFPDNTKVND